MPSVEAQLEREASSRRAAIAAAIGGALLPLVGSIALLAGATHAPSSRAFAAELRFVHRNSNLILASTVLQSLGIACATFALLYLLRATRFRHAKTPRITTHALLAGGVVSAVASVVAQILLAHKASVFVAGADQSKQHAKDIVHAAPLQAAENLAVIGQLSFVLGFLLTSINALRAGLLTRFMGIVGMIAAALLVLPLAPLPVLQAFWLGGLALLYAGRWPNGTPPAWASGRAEPWPSQQELREGRADGAPRPARPGLMDAFRPRPRPAIDPPPEPEPVAPAAGKAHPASKKRKRKKRR